MPVSTISSADELAELSVRMDLPSVLMSAETTFRSTVSHQVLGDGLGVAQARTAPMYLRSGRRELSSARDDLIHLCIHLAGTARVRQHGRVAELAAGDAVIYDSRHPSDIEYLEAGHSLSLHFPRARLASVARVDDLCARTLPATTPAMRMLTTYLRELHTVALPAAVQPAIDLLALTLRTPADPAEALRDYLGANFAESELTVAELARRHHLSPRRVHEIFAATGATPAAYLRTLRLLAARDALADPHRSGQTIARIAKAAGFPELRSFERAFHREYGMSPGTFRRLHR